MKSLLYTCVFLLVCLAIGAASCSRPPERIPVKVDHRKAKFVTNAFQAFSDAVRFTETARAGEDWTPFRSSFDLLGSHFARPEVVERIREEAARNRAFLKADGHLTNAELTDVELASFTTADAHYLDECFLLRDAHRSIEVNDLPPLAQADVHFRWAMRNVLLHEEIDSMIPPAFTLRRGYGSALDRALVFLALLRQTQIDGCLIVVPDAMPQQFLVGVPDSNRASALLFASTLGLGASPLESALAAAPGRIVPDLYLFDTRLGLPLESTDRQRWLTLDEARRDPHSLQAARIMPKQAEKLEAWLVCPLEALAPRMRELQRGLSDHEPITLFLNARKMRDDITQAARVPVTVWNPPAKDKDLPNSPTRSLRLFLAKQDGGIDETDRAAAVARARIPFQTVMANFDRIDMSEGLLPKSAFQLLQFLTFDLFHKYELQAREMYLRGLHDAMVRRQERMQLFARDGSLGRLLNDEKFRTELADWQKMLKSANTNAEHPDPAIRDAAQKAMQKLWAPDPFITWLIEIDKEGKFDTRTMEKTVLTKILAVGMREPFDFGLARSQASVNHEAAAHAQAILTALRAQGKPAATANKTASDAWTVAASSWLNFYLDRLSLDSLINRQLERMHKRAQQPNRDREIDQAIGLLETLHLDVQKYFHAKLCLAECIEHCQGAKACDDYLRNVKSEIEEMEKKGLVRGELEQIQNRFRQFPPAQRRLGFLANDWSEHGSYFWMKQQIDYRIASGAKGS